MTEYIDYTPQVQYQNGYCNACFYNYEGRTFLATSWTGLGHVTKIEQYGPDKLALTISNFYENWKKYLVPSSLSFQLATKDELIAKNGGKPLWFNSNNK